MIGLLREAGVEVLETALTVADFLDADEIFSTGNYSKVVPITRIEDRDAAAGPAAGESAEALLGLGARLSDQSAGNSRGCV